MGRKNSGRVRVNGMSQKKQRSYKFKNSPKGRRDSRDWTYFMLKKLRGAADDRE